MDLPGFNPDPDAPVGIDYMVPAQRHISMGGNWARRLLENELDPGAMRPWVSDDGRETYISRTEQTINAQTGQAQFRQAPLRTYNDSNATLRFLDWIELDNAVIKAAKPRLIAARDLISGGLVYRLPNGIAKTSIQYQQQSDISGATVSMDGLRDGESDRPVFSLLNFPLPIIHKDFQFPLRQVLASRTGYSPLDTTTAELASRRVAEQVEQLTLGTTNPLLLGQSSYAWNANTIYGYMNYPYRLTYPLHLPTAGGWTPQDTMNDILQMKKLSQQNNYFGPWKVYGGLLWDPYMDADYKPTYNSETLRERLLKIKGIQSVETVDYMPDYSLVMVQQTTEVVRMVIGMDIMTVQWESHGGMQLNFKVMCVMIPQLRTDIYHQTGIVHGS